MAKQSAPLSPLDQVMPRSYIHTALLFSTHNPTATISHLQSSLEKLLSRLPYLKGRVTGDPSSRNQLFISWDPDAPAPTIQEVPAPEGCPSYEELVTKGAPEEYFPYTVFPCLGESVDGADGAPVFGVSGVRIQGGVVVCAAMHHNVMDGTGYGEFMKAWAAESRGEEVQGVFDAEEPLRRGERLAKSLRAWGEGVEGDTLERVLEKHPEYKLGSSVMAQAGALPACESRVFTFAVGKLSAVKSSLSSTLPASALTINNILCALLWVHTSHTRSTRPSDPQTSPTSRLGYAVNGRRLLGLEEDGMKILGNVNLLAQARAEMQDLRSVVATNSHDALASIISTIAEATQRIEKEHISSLIRMTDLVPSLGDIGPGWNFVNGPDLSITSWANLGLYDADWGSEVGRPSAVRIPCVNVDGAVVILPRRRDGTGNNERIEVVIMLRGDDMARLCASEAWRGWLVD